MKLCPRLLPQNLQRLPDDALVLHRRQRARDVDQAPAGLEALERAPQVVDLGCNSTDTRFELWVKVLDNFSTSYGTSS